MKKGPATFVVVVLALAVVGFGVWYAVTPGNLDAFNQCMADDGVTFFGAFWCPHCQEQKQLFGKSKDSLPYVECSTPDGRAQLQVCIDEGIKTYPTWEFADGSRQEGVMSLAQLSEKSGCPLPQ